MADDAAPHLAREVQVFEQVHQPQTLLIMAEAERADLIERTLPCVAERRVTEVVAERDRFGKILVEAERPRDRPRDLRDFERVRQPGAVVVALRGDEHLRLVGQAAERLAVQNAVAVALKAGAVRTGRDFPLAARTFVRKGRPRRENVVLPRFKLFADGHISPSPLCGVYAEKIILSLLTFFRFTRETPFFEKSALSTDRVILYIYRAGS